MPAGTTSVILAQKYGGNAELAAKCVLMSTILSMVTMPMLILLIT